jgi:hypothetical protein
MGHFDCWTDIFRFEQQFNEKQLIGGRPENGQYLTKKQCG